MSLKGLKVIGAIEISLEELRPLVDRYILEKYKVPVKKLEIRNGSVCAMVDHELNDVAPFDRVWEAPDAETLRKGRAGRKWVGLYAAVGQVVDAQRKRKRTFISFEDLRAELLEMKDANNNKLFVKNDEELPMFVLKQRLAKSQIPRQAKGQPNLKGVHNKGKGGLSFS